MKLLILGGTAWLGYHTAQAAAAGGHLVTCAARGTSGTPPSGIGFHQTDRDADDGLAGLATEHWDAVIDVSRQPGQVRRAVRDLSAVSDFYLFVSTGNVYAGQSRHGQDEDAPLLAPLASDVMETMESYGPAKAACEQAVTSGFGVSNRAIVRSGLIGGPGDTSGRSGYWPLRFAHPADAGGRVLVPDAGTQPTQLIDVRDLAQWLVELAREQKPGVFNAGGEQMPLGRHLETAAAVAQEAAAGNEAAASVPAQEAWLLGQGVHEWSGPRSLPLWLADPQWHGMNARSNLRAAQAGLSLRPLAETLADTLAWEEAAGVDRPRRAGLTREEEQELLGRLDEAAALADTKGKTRQGKTKGPLERSPSAENG
ncbi:NAD-dependent epimerase/dehydratase family protein [Arthrobacter sp. zg-Y411]|uniref:NAD-dependent epimerase/dehydratase family protein n=1 Tax=Arthrobacter zhangbolii TaxID=2886936 RepID=UPI001D136CFE|nr:NAD-dependent epimerase/dehydratase family protein [Arthrobacter zhangbolii]MCC3293771.1 NAD-dependent epimerase/dehydratase family protein [Arthrobacter zhangbolii]